MSAKTFDDVRQRFEDFSFEENFDLIVAVANGGIVPAALLNQRLGLDMQLLKINLRDKFQKPLYDKPRLLEEIRFDVQDKTILLVEDRVKTGTTLNYAKELLQEAGAKAVKTFAVNGKADYCLYDEMCFRFPWILDIQS
jgi:uncharacterized protein